MNRHHSHVISEHHEALALGLIRADLNYVCGALSRGQTKLAWLFLQYGVLVAYEARAHVAALGYETPDPGWPHEVATAARMSGKYFDDSKRSLEHILDHFQTLTSRNRELFFASDRLGPEFDFLRTDLAVLLLDDVVVLTNITAYFAAGLPPDESLDADRIGPKFGRLAQGIGSTIVEMGADTSHIGPLHVTEERFQWQDADTRAALPELFAGAFDPSVATGLLSISTSVAATEIVARTECCAECGAAALKHRLVVAFHALKSLRVFVRDVDLEPEAHQIVTDVLESAAARTVLSDGYRKLRNGLVHYGLTDVPLPPHPDDFTLEYLVNYYTGAELSDVIRTVDDALAAVAAALTRWSTSTRTGEPGFRARLREPG